jgi:predicted extracellular nuclease
MPLFFLLFVLLVNIVAGFNACNTSLRTHGSFDTTSCPPKDSNICGQIKLIFYNTENFFDTYDDSLYADEEFLPEGVMHWTYQRYKIKLEKISKVIIAAGQWNPPDIVGLCEIENNRVLHDLIHNTPLIKHNYRFVHKNSPDARGIDVALLYNPLTIKLLHSKFIPVHFFNKEQKTTRDILYCMCLVQNTDTLHVFVNHWPSRSGGQYVTEPLRLYAAKILRLTVDSLSGRFKNPKIIIMGDFNDEPEDKSLKVALQAASPVENPVPQSLYNLAYRYTEKNDVGTHKYQGQWSILDQIIVSGELLVAKKGIITSINCFRIFNDPFLLETDTNFQGTEPFRTYKGPIYHGGFSDHLPVILELCNKNL